MFTNKIYDILKSYLDRYLFGFDKNQLNMSIIKGNINLKSVNIRPDEANRLIDGLMLPITLKAGMIGNLQLKFSILSIWNNPMEVTIDDLFLILGPNLSFVSHEESYIKDEELDESYDSTNVYNIFEHELQIKKKQKNIDKASQSGKDKQQDDNDENSIKNNFRNFMRNLKLIIKRVHIRFEDDYFSADTPFSLGFVIDRLDLLTEDSEWLFDQPLQLQYSRVRPQHLQEEQKGLGSIILKELNLTNAKMYLNSISEMFIPTSLWEQTRHLENQIFDALPLDSLNDLMFHMYSNIYNYKAQPNNQKQSSLMRIKLLFTSFELNLTPQLIDDLSRLYEFIQNFSISLDLKQYRPQRRPYILDPDNKDIDPNSLDEHVKRKRKLLVRDWFFYVVWYVRLRKLLLNLYSEEVIEQEIEQNKEKYEGLFKAAENGKESLKRLIEEKEKLQLKDLDKKKEEEGGKQRKWDEIQNLFKCQSISLRIYENYEKYRTKDKQSVPSFEIHLDTLVIDNVSNYVTNSINKKLMIKSIKMLHSQLIKRSLLVKQNQQNNDHKPLTQREPIGNNGNLMRNGTKPNQLSQQTHQQSNAQISNMNQRKLMNNGLPSAMGLRSQRSSEYNQINNYNMQNPNKSISDYSNPTRYQPNAMNNQYPSQYAASESIYHQQPQHQVPQKSTTVANTTSTSNGAGGVAGSSFLDNMFGFKSVFENIFANFGGGGGNIQTSNGNYPNEEQIRQQATNQFQQSPLSKFDMTNGSYANGGSSHQASNQNLSANKIVTERSITQMIYNNSQQQNIVNRNDNSYYLNTSQSIIKNQANISQKEGDSRALQRMIKANVYNSGATSANRKNNYLEDDLNMILNMNVPTMSQQRSPTKSAQNNRLALPLKPDNSTLGALQNQQSRWPLKQQDHNSQQLFVIVTKQFASLESNQSFQPAFYLQTKRIYNETNSKGHQADRSLEYHLTLGNLNIEYSNEIIKNACDTLLRYKQLHIFRYIPLRNLFQRRENIHRKIQLHAPLYLIKKMFVKGGRSSNLMNPDNYTKSFHSNQGNTKINRQTFRCDTSEEDENISDEEERDNQLMGSRKVIQQAVSQKASNFGVSHRRKDQIAEDKVKQGQALTNLGSLDQADQMMFKKIVNYERRYSAFDVQINVDFNQIELLVLPSINEDSGLQGAMCSFKIKQNQVQLYKGKEESGFDAFGMQFQTLNRYEMYFLFFKSMRRAIETYTCHPVFGQSSQTYFDQFRQIYRENVKQKTAQDQRITIKNVLGLNNNNNPDLQQVQNQYDPRMTTQIFNQEGVKQQQELFNKGKTNVAGIRKKNQYDILFNQMEDNNSESSLTPKLSYKELHFSAERNTTTKLGEGQQLRDQQPAAQINPSYDSPVQLQAFSTDENQHEEEEEEEDKKEIEIQITDKIIEVPLDSQQTPIMNLGKGSKLANISSPLSFLQSIKEKQQQQQISKDQTKRKFISKDQQPKDKSYHPKQNTNKDGLARGRSQQLKEDGTPNNIMINSSLPKPQQQTKSSNMPAIGNKHKTEQLVSQLQQLSNDQKPTLQKQPVPKQHKSSMNSVVQVASNLGSSYGDDDLQIQERSNAEFEFEQMLHKNMLNPTALTKTKSSSTTDHNQINTNGGITGGINFSKSPYGIQVNQGKKKVSQMGLGVNESKRI